MRAKNCRGQDCSNFWPAKTLVITSSISRCFSLIAGNGINIAFVNELPRLSLECLKTCLYGGAGFRGLIPRRSR